MKGLLHTWRQEGRSCACWVPEGPGPFPLLVLCGWHLEDKLPLFARELPSVLLFFGEAQGDRDFTPWPAAGVREEEQFSGGGEEYLRFLTEGILPRLEGEFHASSQPEHRGILGYSLGGLFALWAQGQGEWFSLAGSLSGSLWYPHWLAYMEQHPPRPGEKVYLSLGDREEFGGPPLLRTVGDCTRRAYAFYRQQGVDTVLEWNKGGHGKGVEGRWKKALAWAAPRVASALPPQGAGPKTKE